MDVEALSRGTEVGHLERPRVAVDAMGGDHAPEEVVRGAVDWARLHKDVEVILVGDEARMRPFIEEPLPSHVRIVQASETVGMGEQPAVAVRRKRDASINVAMRLVRDGEADAVVTAGHTGAGVASAILHLKRLPGVDRPALAVQMITDSGPLILLDIGATTDSTGVNLAQYAHMGSLFSERVLGVKEPTVALLSIGEESGKGEQRVQDATALLKDSHLRFIGNVEGRDVPHHPADVVVCDASVGNVVMKFFEGLSTVMFDMLRKEFKRPPWGPIGYFFMRPGYRPHPGPFRLREAGRGAAARRQRHRAHHPRRRTAPHDRLRRGGHRPGGPGAHPRAHHGEARLRGRGPLHRTAQGGRTAPRRQPRRGRRPRGRRARRGPRCQRGCRGRREWLKPETSIGAPLTRAPATRPPGCTVRSARAGRWPWLPSSRPNSACARPGPSCRAASTRVTSAPVPPRTRASWWRSWSRTGTASTPGSRSWRPPIRSCSWPASTAPCCVAAWVNCYTAATTPAKVAISEWVELARIYSGEPTRRLMNGALGRVAKDVTEAQRGDAPSGPQGEMETEATSHTEGPAE